MGKRLRDDFDERGLQLAQMLRSWDILGVYRMEGVPPDHEEYDDLVGPILKWLAGNAGPEELSARLVGRLDSHYGLRPISELDELDFARQIHDWWIRGGP